MLIACHLFYSDIESLALDSSNRNNNNNNNNNNGCPDEKDEDKNEHWTGSRMKKRWWQCYYIGKMRRFGPENDEIRKKKKKIT